MLPEFLDRGPGESTTLSQQLGAIGTNHVLGQNQTFTQLFNRQLDSRLLIARECPPCS